MIFVEGPETPKILIRDHCFPCAVSQGKIQFLR
jgi:hypothetical protein